MHGATIKTDSFTLRKIQILYRNHADYSTHFMRSNAHFQLGEGEAVAQLA
jgi:hypothetical protein